MSTDLKTPEQLATLPIGTDRELLDASRAVLRKFLKGVEFVCVDVFELIPTLYTDDMLPTILPRQHHLMNVLGDILDSVDAVDEADEWMGRVFDAFRERVDGHNCCTCSVCKQSN